MQPAAVINSNGGEYEMMQNLKKKVPSNGNNSSTISTSRREYLLKISSALFYAIVSFLITISNKSVLTSYHFPSVHVLSISQLLSTIIILTIFKRCGFVQYSDYSPKIFRKMWPLQIIFLGNLVFGLDGTKHLSLPMFTVLRRFSILLTMVGELILLNINPPVKVQICVYAMVIGAVIAASHDLAFNANGYCYVLLNDLFTAANGVFMKKKLVSKDLTKNSLMFYNAVYTVVPVVIVALLIDDFDALRTFEYWSSPGFWLHFILSSALGFVLSYSVILCTFYNSALTTTIVGCLKNVLITYVGMTFGGDYIFSYVNFVGINISVIASLFYTYVTFRRPNKSPPVTPTAEESAATSNNISDEFLEPLLNGGNKSSVSNSIV